MPASPMWELPPCRLALLYGPRCRASIWAFVPAAELEPGSNAGTSFLLAGLILLSRACCDDIFHRKTNPEEPGISDIFDRELRSNGNLNRRICPRWKGLNDWKELCKWC